MTKNIVLAALDPRNEPEPPDAEPAESRTTPQADWEYIPSRRPKVVMDRGAILIKNGRMVPIGQSVAGPLGRNGKPMIRSIGTKRLGRRPGSDLLPRTADLLRYRKELIASDRLTQETMAEKLGVQKVTVQRFFRTLRRGEPGFWKAFCATGALPPPR